MPGFRRNDNTGVSPSSPARRVAAVEEFFHRRPQTDVVFADMVVVDKQGQFACCRNSWVPLKNTMWIYNPVISGSVFIHRRVLDQHGLFFDTRWRDLGDIVWTVEMSGQFGRVAELADAKDLGSSGVILADSTPVAPSIHGSR